MESTNAQDEERVREELSQNGKEAVFNLGMSAYRTDKRFDSLTDSLQKSIEMTAHLAEKVNAIEQILENMSNQKQQEKMTAVAGSANPQKDDLGSMIGQILQNAQSNGS